MYQLTQLIHPPGMRPEIRPDVVKVMVTLERPPPKALKQLNRGERFQLLQENANRARARIIEWIEGQGLSTEVTHISQPTAFNLLFVEATQQVTNILDQAPCVVSVAMTDGIQSNLLGATT